MRTEEKRISLGWYALVLFLILAAGRATTFLYNNVAVDVAYAEWTSEALRYGKDILNAAKNALGYSAIAYAAWNLSLSMSNWTTLLFFAGLVAENVARFLIDWFASSLGQYGVEMALISLGLQLLYETIFLLLAWLTARLSIRFFHQSNSRRRERRYSAENAARFSILLLLAAQLVSEIVYLIQFLNAYTDITNTEIASCVGSFLYIIFMYGGIPLLLSGAAFWFLRRITR